jgi:uncharacterized short protein YbdD (DUF466 family)
MGFEMLYYVLITNKTYPDSVIQTEIKFQTEALDSNYFDKLTTAFCPLFFAS